VQFTINDGGTNYTNVTVTFSAPDQAGGEQAAGEAVTLANTIVEILVTEPGTGYTAAPTITITDAGGSNANVQPAHCLVSRARVSDVLRPSLD
jgi:hypothetical protein